MSPPKLRQPLLALSLGAALLTPAAQACGPDFSLRLLGDRAQTLAELPESSFTFEISRLGTAIAGLKPAAQATLQPYGGDSSQLYIEQRQQIEQLELTPAELSRIQQLRSLTDARQAEAEGADLAAELRLYSAGAVAFAQNDDALAAEYFRRVLALPASERVRRSSWASYSLGRNLARSVDPEYAQASPENLSPEQIEQARHTAVEAAKAAFQLTRKVVAEGADDPLELGVASLGEEARLYKDEGDWALAIRLYASQARLDSMTGYSSLKMLAGELTALPQEQLIQLLHQLEVQQLLTAYLSSQVGWFSDEQPDSEQQLAALLQRSDIALLANADRLAALSYQYGNYPSAAAFLAHAGDSGLAWWLRAKLALHAGDKETARAAYAKAAKAFPADEDWGSRRGANWDLERLKPHCRVEGENAVLALERGNYLEAFEQLYRSGDVGVDIALEFIAGQDGEES